MRLSTHPAPKGPTPRGSTTGYSLSTIERLDPAPRGSLYRGGRHPDVPHRGLRRRAREGREPEALAQHSHDSVVVDRRRGRVPRLDLRPDGHGQDVIPGSVVVLV